MSAAPSTARRWLARGCSLTIAVLALVAVARADGQTADDAGARFEAANAAFAAGRYDEARAGFEGIVEHDGASPGLLYNLGNASLRAGLIGQAILSYERALLLSPRDQDVLANLRQARTAANLTAPDDDRWTRFVHLLTASGWAWLASAGLYLLCGAVLAARLLAYDGERASLRTSLRALALGAAALLAVGAVTCAERLRERDRAVILASDPALRVAPYASATVASELAPGEIVRIERAHQGFALVRTAAGKSGWVSEGSVARIAPPPS